ncbi:MAG: hypothetical protein WC263_03385 [Candidatus Micrarchaeia archaeon]
MAVAQEMKPDPSKFSNLSKVKPEVFNLARLPRRKFFHMTLSGPAKKIADATNIMQTCIDAAKEKRQVKDPLFKMGVAIRKLKGAIHQGDASDSTLLILGSAYALEGHIADAQMACLALRDRGNHSYENLLGAMVSYGEYLNSKSDDQLFFADRMVFFHNGQENEERGKQLIDGSPVPDIALQVLEVKKAQTRMFD